MPTALRFRAALLALMLSAPSATAQNAPAASAAPLPRPVGFINDFAKVLRDSTARALGDSILALRSATGGEIAIVTVVDLAGESAEIVAQRYGSEWGVGAKSGPAQFAGTMVLIAPRETSTDGKGHCYIAFGVGTSTFISDSTAAAICESAVPAFRRRDYSEGVWQITLRLIALYRQRFNAP